jgi:cell division protein FtsW
MSKTTISYRTSLICASAFLSCLGILAIYASSSVPASHTTGNPFYYVQKQAIVVVLGYFIVFLLGHLPFHFIERATLPALLLTLLSFVLVYLPQFSGSAGGATRWILIGGISVQPGEFAKLALVLFLAKNLARTGSDMNRFAKGVLPNLIICGLFIAVLMTQPDFGTAALLFVITFLMLVVAGMPRTMVLGFICAGIAALVSAIIAAPYRVARLLTFLDPWAEARGGGFQIIQSYVGFQNGGLFGAGLGESRQKLFFLPEAHTDFILSVVGEELGLFGVLLICGLFAYLVFLGLAITNRQKITYRKFLAFGLTMLIAIQAVLNMGVTMGMLPTKGMTLPFVSNGANSLLVFLVAIAILARISQEDQTADAKAST